MPQPFQSFNIICIETILSSGHEQHEVLCSTVATVGHGTRLCAVCSAKPAKNVGCIGDATTFSIFQYYMYRDNSILRRRAARSAVLHRQLPWVMGPGYVLWERKACKKCRMYTVMPQSFNIIPACMYRDSSILRRRAARIEQFLNSPIQFIDYMKLIN